MNTKLLKEELNKYKRQYKIILLRNADLENQYQVQEEKIQLLTECLENSQKAIDINKTIVRQALASYSEKEQILNGEIIELKKRLKELENGNLC